MRLSGLAWKANWLLLAGDVQGLFTARYVTVSEGGVDTFFVLFPEAQSQDQRTTSDPEDPFLFVRWCICCI